MQLIPCVQSFSKLLQKSYFLFIISFILGCSLTLIFNPYNFLIFIVSLSGLLTLLDYAKNSYIRFWIGFSFGFGHFLTGLHWIVYALCTDIHHFGWMIPFTIIIPCIIACFIGFITLTNYYFRANKIIYVITFSLIWVGIELIRSYAILPFPWNLLGYGAVSSMCLLQSAHFLSIHGFSFLLCLTGSCFYTKNIRYITLITLFISVIFSYGYIRLINSQQQMHSSDYTYRVIQPNLIEHHLGDPNKQEVSLSKLISMTSFKAQPFSIIIWPEAAFPYLIEDKSSWINIVSKVIPQSSYLLMGCDRIEEKDSNLPQIYNSLFAINSFGQVQDIYDKVILVPFGEYVPLRSNMPSYMKGIIQKVSFGMYDFSRGSIKEPIKLNKTIPKILVLICYEIAFPNLIAKYDLDDIGLLLNITNNAWFGNSIGPYQQFAMARMRAVEFGIPVATVANNGISAIIDPYGRVIDQLSLNEEGILEFMLPERLYLSSFVNKFKVSTIGCFIILILTLFFIKKQLNKFYPNF